MNNDTSEREHGGSGGLDVSETRLDSSQKTQDSTTTSHQYQTTNRRAPNKARGVLIVNYENHHIPFKKVFVLLLR